MKNLLKVLVVLFFVFSTASAAEVISPNAKIKVIFALQDESQAQFSVQYTDGQKTTEVLPLSPLGLKTSQEDFSRLTLVSESKETLVHDDYEMIHGKKKHCENTGIEKTFRMKNATGKCIDLVFRVYNDGVAFRYLLSEYDGAMSSITDELTAYAVADGVKRWVQPYTGYEDFYPLSTNIGSSRRWAYPALFNLEDDVFMLITEADIHRENYASSLTTSDNSTFYKVVLPPDDRDGNHITLPWQSPWRVLMVGHLADVFESTLVTDVSSPNRLAETDWIQPGAASWIYWANNHGTKDYKKLVEYVDLAAEMKWPYTLIDWEWDQMSNGGNIIDIVNYAKSKGVKALMWYNSGTTWIDSTPKDRMNSPERRAKEFAWLNEIGVYGVKVDFFAGDQQKTMNDYISILEDAARYKLMVNFHGCTLPRGWSRTYPNLMSMEGVSGAEQYNNGPVMTSKGAEHNATLPFTRNVVGPMDYTPVAFTDSQHPHTTTYAHELALAVVFESGIQHFADRPSGFTSLPAAAKDFMSHVPTAWDNSKLVQGYPGQLVVVAREKAGKWYIGGINGEDKDRQVKLDLSFLPKDISFDLTLIKDGADAKTFDTADKTVKAADSIEIKMLGRGGFAGVLTERK